MLRFSTPNLKKKTGVGRGVRETILKERLGSAWFRTANLQINSEGEGGEGVKTILNYFGSSQKSQTLR